MAFFDDVETRSIPELMRAFDASGHPPDIVPVEDRALWYQEAARRIAQSGTAGLDFLLDHAVARDDDVVGGVLLGLSFAGKEAVARRRAHVREVLLNHLADTNPLLVSQAIDSLNSLGFTETAEQILPLLRDDSPYVVGSVLRYISHHDPARAQPLLLDALGSAEPIVRQNAVDELDELACLAALPRIRPLLNDVDEDVRWAAQTAVHNLEQSLRARNLLQEEAQQTAGD
jgi:HEAT repeat protein